MLNKYIILKTIVAIPVTAMLAIGSASAADAPKKFKRTNSWCQKGSNITHYVVGI
jgi:hypothetical protein